MPKTRNIALDRYRGLAIIMMTIVNCFDATPLIPAWLKHAPDYGYTIADLVAPMFLFAIAVTYRPGYLRRLEKGAKKLDTVMHFVTRYLALIGVGCILSTFEPMLMGHPTNWGVMQAIGVAGLLTLLVVKLPLIARAIVGVVVLAGYQFANTYIDGFRNMVFAPESGHGGIGGAVAWGCMLILATVLMELHEKGFKPFAIATGILGILSAGAWAWWKFAGPVTYIEIAKNRVSAGYVIVSLFFCCALYIFIEEATRALPKIKAGVVSFWGENPIFFYMVHLMMIGVAKGLFAETGLAIIPACAVVLTLMSLLAWTFHRKKIYISL